jgi:hypothetical protein
MRAIVTSDLELVRSLSSSKPFLRVPRLFLETSTNQSQSYQGDEKGSRGEGGRQMLRRGDVTINSSI